MHACMHACIYIYVYDRKLSASTIATQLTAYSTHIRCR